ncbi:DNA gyrase inhibitor YacG [Rhodobacter sp. TJ_12]|uniref:DNA gyrase inhibitor YacG n=1 Tax=Rhodobacter sp. TJ_12 TaxID=2029399 RepID=UPI001CBDF4E1|nr:DNA gyrase inhibitor YacG [Rhodobacter sp. TJ_12]MBZ4023401.1 DNA gyrase inhibitor YacG [Rhodobacter sp. TJ_12]
MSCPICGKDKDPKYRPFCSKRCADIDLARWLNGSYVIPGEALEEDDPAPEEGPGTPGPGLRH